MRFDALPNLQIGGLNREFAPIMADLRRLIPQVAPEWTYTDEDDFGIVILELAAYLADHLHYRADATLRDCLPTRSPHREIVREYAEWLGYLARRAAPAEADVTFSVPAALAEPVALSRGLRVSGNGPKGAVVFEVSDDVVLAAGQVSVPAHVVEGTTVLTALLGNATGAPGERFTIPHTDCIFNWGDDEIEVTVADLPAAHFKYPALLNADDLGFWVRQAPSGLLELRFGDGTYGKTLPPGAAVRATYRRGGGVAGNVSAGAINTVLDTVRLSDGSAVTLRVTNAERGAGGAPEETTDSIRVQAPASYRSQHRAVTHDDYVAHVLTVPGVFRARIAAYGVNGVRVFVVPDGVADGATVTASLRRAIIRALDSVRMCTDSISVEAARLVTVDVYLNVRAVKNSRNGVVRELIRQRFISGTTGIFVEDRNDLGAVLYQSDMVREVEAITGVSSLDVLKYARRPQLRWLATVGTAALSSAGVVTNVTTRAQTWRIEMVSATEFIVVGSVSGQQSTLGEFGAAWTDDLNEVGFTIEAGAVAAGEGDTAEIVVGELRGNIELEADEFPVFDARSVTIQVTGGIGA
jgi:hypothetical protein